MRKLTTKTIRSNKGFTLIELVVVITILAILGVVAINGVGGVIAKSKAQADISVADNIGTAVAAAFAEGKIKFASGASEYNEVLVEPTAAAPDSERISRALFGPGLTYDKLPETQAMPNGHWHVSVTRAGGVYVAIGTETNATVITAGNWSTDTANKDNYVVVYPKDNVNFSDAEAPYDKLYVD